MLTPRRGTNLRTFMLVVAPLLAVTVIAVATFAQSSNLPPKAPALAGQMESQIRQKLASQGFDNIEILPASHLVSARDKEGNSFLLVIAPDSTTVLAMERSALDNDADSSGPSTAETPDKNSGDKDGGRERLIQQ